MTETSNDWNNTATAQPDPEKYVLALWMPPHCPLGERVLVLARRRRVDWEVVCAGTQQCFNRGVPAAEIQWWRELSAPGGIEFATG